MGAAKLNGVGCVIFTCVLTTHPIASVTDIVYIVDDKPRKIPEALLIAPGCIVKVSAPVPAPAVTAILPLFPVLHDTFVWVVLLMIGALGVIIDCMDVIVQLCVSVIVTVYVPAPMLGNI